VTELGPLRAIVEAPDNAAVLVDFDGTLAPIVPRPEAAVALPGIAGLLRRLSEHLGVVGVISGRPPQFLRARLAEAGPRVRLVGLYGMAWVQADRLSVHPAVLPWLAAAGQAATEAATTAPSGVVVEPKTVEGAVLSVTLHWRQAPEREAWCRQAADRWAQATGLAVQDGRMAVELRPPVPVDKGTAVAELASACSSVLYAGDDLGDLAAFDALRELAQAGRRVLRVAVVDQETPSALLERADLALPGPSAWLACLRRLARALGEPPG
jgi:trehalose 6-phosphate phosphatase